MKKYCYIKPEFPKNAFIISVFYHTNEQVLIFPLSGVFINTDSAGKAIEDIVKSFKRKKIEVPDETIMIPITFEKLFPLKIEYWEGEHQNYSFDEKMHLFLGLFDKPEFHKLLITPFDYDNATNEFDFKAALPLKRSGEDHTIQQFMQHSDFPVNMLASHAAIYIPGQPARYNWKTKKIDFPKKYQREEVNKN